MKRPVLALVTLLIAVGPAQHATAECVTIYEGTPPSCSQLNTTSPSSTWVAAGPTGSVLVINHYWGKGKSKPAVAKPQRGPQKAPSFPDLEVRGPSRAGTGAAGPICWRGAAPQYLYSTTVPRLIPEDTGWLRPDFFSAWHGVTNIGFCVLCCTSDF